MKSIAEIRDPHLVKAILAVEDMYERFREDGSPSLSEFIPDMYRNIWVAFYLDGNITGFGRLEKLTEHIRSCHIGIFEQYRGKGSTDWGKMALDYVRKNYGAKHFLAYSPFESARRYGKKIGFKEVAILKKAMVKNGKEIDICLMERD